MRRLREYLPQGLYGRALAIIILPVAVMQIAIAYVFLDDLWNAISRRMAAALAGDIAVAIELYERDPSPENVRYVGNLILEKNQISLTYLPGEKLPTTKTRAPFSILDQTLKRTFQDHLQRAFWFDARQYPRYVEIRVPVTGGVMQFITSGKRAYVTSGHVFLLWVIALTALLTTVSVLFIRNQVRPILRLAKLAEAFGRGEDAPDDYRQSGAREVRQAATSVFLMRERIKSHVEQRTQLLAAVSHDLRTPLTRLKLGLALLPDGPDQEGMRRDLKDMEHMLDEYLAFARGQWVEEPEPVDMGTLVSELAASFNGRIKVECQSALIANVRAGAIRRCLANLMDNAISHAQAVEVKARWHFGSIEITVDDDGPGIPAERREEALNAFTRLDPARNQNTKGVGLGLAIARDVARGHGGDLTLDDSPLGGLRAIVHIPALAVEGGALK